MLIDPIIRDLIGLGQREIVGDAGKHLAPQFRRQPSDNPKEFIDGFKLDDPASIEEVSHVRTPPLDRYRSLREGIQDRLPPGVFFFAGLGGGGGGGGGGGV